MMPLGPELTQVLSAAQWEAARQGKEKTDSGHLLLGLFHTPLTPAARVLASLGVQPKPERLASPPTPSDDVWPPPIPVSALTHRLAREGDQILRFAEQEAETRGDSVLGPEHLILGLLREKHCLGAMLLYTHGLTAEKLRPLLFAIRRPG
jgi:ATP-dependent Clp protease ATP-binding subunit ClpA